MPAGILKHDRFGEVRARGARAWHGLGEELPLGITVEEGFQQIGLGWGTRLLPLRAILQLQATADSPARELELPVADNFAHVREDTQEVLAVVGPNYRPIGNMEMARFADSLVGEDATVQAETAGSLYNGRRVFCSLKLPRTIEVVDDDVLELWVILSNGHDGNAAFHVYPSAIRPVCTNTLTASERDLSRGLRVSHTGTIVGKIDKARQVLGLVVHENDRFADEVKMVHRLQLNKAQATEYFKAVYTRVFGEIRKATGEDQKDEDGTVIGKDTQGRREQHRDKIIARWVELLDHKNQNIKGITGTAWAAYNAFSQWSDHERGNMRGVQESDVRIHSNLFGISNLTKRRAWDEALALV